MVKLYVAAAAARQHEVGMRLRCNTGMQGAVLYSNYGYKSNEELILGYGFALADNAANFFHVMIGLSDKPSTGADTLTANSRTCSIHLYAHANTHLHSVHPHLSATQQNMCVTHVVSKQALSHC